MKNERVIHYRGTQIIEEVEIIDANNKELYL